MFCLSMPYRFFYKTVLTFLCLLLLLAPHLLTILTGFCVYSKHRVCALLSFIWGDLVFTPDTVQLSVFALFSPRIQCSRVTYILWSDMARFLNSDVQAVYSRILNTLSNVWHICNSILVQNKNFIRFLKILCRYCQKRSVQKRYIFGHIEHSL